jgi:predicted Rossmann-fold nucleotide-binding protein
VEKNNGEVKDAAMLGAAEAERTGTMARLIGILPEHKQDWKTPIAARWNRPSPYRLFLQTGLAHNVRNVINGRAPDVLVAFGGSRGTLAELAFALSAGRKVFVHRGFKRLSKNFDKYFSPDAKECHRETYFANPLRLYPAAAPSVEELLARLRAIFAHRASPEVGAINLAKRIADTTDVDDRTGFPGLPHEPDAKECFERIVAEMS